jgi:hypothetical protein
MIAPYWQDKVVVVIGKIAWFGFWGCQIFGAFVIARGV